jgi:uncharacterized protein
MRYLCLALPILTLAAPARAQTTQQAPTIRVVGEGKVSVKPDMAELDVGVTSQGTTAAAAAAENASKMDKVIAALKKEVGAGGEVKTASYNVTPRYGQAPKPGQDRLPIVGYTVTNMLHVRVPDIQAVGRILDLTVKLGVNEVPSVTYGLKDYEPARAEALKAAALKARAHATALAGALGLKLGPLVSVTEGGAQGPIPMEFGMEKRALHAAATPVEAGTLDVEATVTAVFATSPR